MIIHGELMASVSDPCQYITLVFKILDPEFTKDTKYIMCTVFPNWEWSPLKIGDKGYVHFEIIKAGKDEWWDGTKMTKYNYDMIQFIKFVPDPINEDKHEYIL